MNTIVKICKIHGELTEKQVYFSKKNKQCKLCCETYRNNPENKERKNKLTSEYIKADKKNNPVKYKERQRKYHAKYRDLITAKAIAYNRGISLEEYNKIIESQGDKCSICYKKESKISRNGKICRLSLDHCHITNKIRGLLCHQCNILIGCARDNILTLENAILYLRRYSNVEE